MLNTRNLIMNAIIAALYAALTIGLAPLSYGPIQVRLSECLTLLAFYNRSYVPGLVVGCFIANLGSPFGTVDLVIGTAATFIALYLMRFCQSVWQASLMPVLANGIIIALELAYLGEVPMDASLVGVMFYIALGEAIAVIGLGIGIMKLLLRNQILRSYLLGDAACRDVK